MVRESRTVKRTHGAVTPRTSELQQLSLSPDSQLPEKDLGMSAEPVA